jgi:hypothetical protein
MSVTRLGYQQHLSIFLLVIVSSRCIFSSFLYYSRVHHFTSLYCDSFITISRHGMIGKMLADVDTSGLSAGKDGSSSGTGE